MGRAGTLQQPVTESTATAPAQPHKPAKLRFDGLDCARGTFAYLVVLGH